MDIKYKKVSGVYKLIHQKRGIIYIGSAVCLYSRLHAHYSNLKKGIHDNKILQAVYNRYGRENLTWEVIEVCDKLLVVEREQHYLDTLKPEMNICKYAQNTTGYRHTDEMKKEFSRKREGNKNSLGRVLSEETKQIIADKAKKRGISPELRKAAIAANTGRKHSKEFRDRLSKIQSKITPVQAAEIKKKRAEGVYQYQLAKEYGVSQRLIVRVEKGLGLYGTPEFKEQTAQQKLFL